MVSNRVLVSYPGLVLVALMVYSAGGLFCRSSTGGSAPGLLLERSYCSRSSIAPNGIAALPVSWRRVSHGLGLLGDLVIRLGASRNGRRLPGRPPLLVSLVSVSH